MAGLTVSDLHFRSRLQKQNAISNEIGVRISVRNYDVKCYTRFTSH